MDQLTPTLNTLNDIKKMMEKSSRFISLSGWSGIAAGLCGLTGAYFANRTLTDHFKAGSLNSADEAGLKQALLLIAAIVFSSAFITAFFFTYLRTRRDGTPIWGQSSRRLLWNTVLPMIVGGVVILRLIITQNYTLISPCMLIFYGLALVNGSKYTLGEIRFVGYIEIILGFVNLWYPGEWLLLWTIGFGVMHIIYGVVMWWKYER